MGKEQPREKTWRSAGLVLIVVVALVVGWFVGRGSRPGPPTPPATGTVTPANPEVPELQPETPVPPTAEQALQRFQQGESVFIENRGQWEAAQILFALDSQGANVGVTAEGPRFQLFRREPAPNGETAEVPPEPPPRRADRDEGPPMVTHMHEFGVRFPGAKVVTPEGETKSERVFHYQKGKPENWRQNVPSWLTVCYRGLYPGVDLRLRGRRSALKYEFIVAPGADWRPIQLRYTEIDRLELAADGHLTIHLAEGWPPLTDAPPIVYQEVAGERRELAAACRLVDDHTVTFTITGDVDPALPLIIDPCWDWSPAALPSSEDRHLSKHRTLRGNER